ncbi:MAG: immunoglobulin-like domain-containing protein [Bacteroidota bacterium]
MKRYLNIITVGLLSMALFSCKEDSFNYPEGTVGISKITIYPILTVKGDKYVFVAKGGTYTEAGVEAKAGEAVIEVKTNGQVNTGAAAVYTLVYSAANSDGFSASASRYVVVYDTKPDAAANDFTGSYKRAGFDTFAVWAKKAPGVYLVTNPGGAVGNTDVVIAINPSGNSIQIPAQDSPVGAFSSSVGTLNAGSYSWALVNAGYGPQSRSFSKQ